jgi:hypothetical protein
MSRPLGFLLLLAAVFFGFAATIRAADVTAERSEKGAAVKIDGQPFTEYLTRSGAKPILWPIIGPTGKPMTRAYPMDEGQDEKKDHIHQRSMWFTHGDVNGVNFWAETGKHGTIEHREFVRMESGPQAVIVTRNDWIGPDGKKHCEDQRKFTFGVDGGTRRIDFDITLKAANGPVKFGDTKEGTMGLRIAQTMNVDTKLGGRIVNSDGQTDLAAWGKQAAWVDYYGPVDGQTVGIAILNHPSSFRFPTYWHVRTYGLFTANPFGWHDFKGSDKVDGSFTIAAGKSITLRYRILFHKGDEKAAKIAEAYAAYARQSE